MNIEAIRALIATDMQAVDRLIHERLTSEVVLINQLGQYIINSGGKRLRPALALLAARACGYAGDQHHPLAAIIEFIHTATLLHDDVVDASELRRGRETANALWGNEASVLVGDFLYSRAFQMMVEVGSMRILDILAQATNRIAEGEVLQLLNIHDADTTEARYLEVIHCKTAKLFEAAAESGAVLSGRGPECERALALYGMHLGTAFQLIDDVLDYSADPAATGKNLGDDLAEGKPTLPVIIALQRSDAATAARLRSAIETGGREHLPAVLTAIESTDAIAYTARLAAAEADAAQAQLGALPGSPHREALVGLARFAADRQM